MRRPIIVEEGRAVTLVGGADLNPDDITEALRLAPVLVAADGGADCLLAQGHVPRAVIGDMDSLSAPARAAFAHVLHEVSEQDSTDFDKALRHISAPLVVALGFSGGRLDHELAALHGLIANAGQPCIVTGPESLTFLCPPDIALDLPAGDVVSLFPLVPVRVASTGLRWPTDHLTFAPDGRIGTSNAAEDGPVVLRAERPGMLVILPRASLTTVAAAFMRPGVLRWE